MGGTEVDKKVLLRWKFVCLFICWGVFYVIYSLTGAYASTLEHVPSLSFSFEKYIPFISCTIYPYMSSGLFFTLVFFLCRTSEELAVLSKRILFITVVSGACFFLFPLRQSFVRPETTNLLFSFLNQYDTPFNQAPSLHIGYIFIFWTALRNNKYKQLLRVWLCVMALSTLTLYQHHLIDVISAYALGCVTSLLFPYCRERNKQIAKVYLLASTPLLTLALFAAESSLIGGVMWLWCVVTLLLMARAYYQSDDRFLKNNKGEISIFKYILYFHYLLTYRIMWMFSRTSYHEIAPDIYVGGRLSQSREIRFSHLSDVTVFDLSAELPENSFFRKVADYHCFPMLDIASTPDAYLQEIVNAILEKADTAGKIYIHCTMGRLRSRQIGELLLHRMKNNIKTEIR